MPPKKNPELYNLPKTFFWFFVISMVLTGCLVGIVMTDYNREWKVWQKKFVQLKLEKSKIELKAAEQGVDKKKLEDLGKQLVEADKTFAANKGEYAKLQKDIQLLDSRGRKARAHYQTLKQYQDSYRYYFEEYSVHKDSRADKYGKRLSGISPKVEKARLALEALERDMDAKTAQAGAMTAKEKELNREIAKVLTEKNLVEGRIAKLKPSIATDVLNAPMLDFVAPSLKVQQIVLDDLYDDYHFAKTQKVDRCMTCHLGIDQKGFETAPQPFRTHPKLDLYLGSMSPHPVEKFGCTVCHSGSGHSVSFKDSAHTPQNEEQAKEWAKKHGWKELEKWDAKMLPLDHVQAACAKCHTGVVEVPKADKLNEGRKLAEESGCFNCHKIENFENRWKVGPDLSHVASKLTPEWISKWVDNPTHFRASTKMPRAFNLSNTSTPEDIDKNAASIEAITSYLVKNSTPVTLNEAPVAGDAARGEKYVEELGCLGCHSAPGIAGNDVAPELTGLGSKTTEAWLYTWLKNPKHYSPNTRMPSLRLSDQEAADITQFLIANRNADFEAKAVPQAKPAVVDNLILTSLQGTMRDTEARAQLAGMSKEEKMEFLGKKAIGHQGCFACHTIKGFEEAKPIGAELTNEGHKDLHQFDFGFVHIDHTRQGWLTQKLKDPRSFDMGKNKAYYDKLRMPQFNFTDEQRHALVTFLLSLTEEKMPLEMTRRLTLDEEKTEKGRLLVSKLNCAGCHAIDGHPGFLREQIEDKGSAPPTLEGEGAKVREKWLHEFLHAPTPIRPWLTYRMPTFDFTNDELKALVTYFDHLSGQHITYEDIQAPETTADDMAAGKQLFDMLQCAKCHEVSPETAAMGTSFLAPDLTLSKSRLKPDWVHAWIRDPQVLEPGTMMPTFFSDGQSPLPDILGGDAEKQIDAIKDYLYRYEKDGSKK